MALGAPETRRNTKLASSAEGTASWLAEGTGRERGVRAAEGEVWRRDRGCCKASEETKGSKTVR